MAITYDWHIANLEHEIEDGFVYTAHWIVKATEPTGETDEDGDPEVYSADAYGSVSLSRPDNLIPYENLTKEIVVGWVKGEFGIEKVAKLQEGLAAQIELQKYPTSASGVPW
jgi:hypothetical protein